MAIPVTSGPLTGLSLKVDTTRAHWPAWARKKALELLEQNGRTALAADLAATKIPPGGVVNALRRYLRLDLVLPPVDAAMDERYRLTLARAQKGSLGYVWSGELNEYLLGAVRFAHSRNLATFEPVSMEQESGLNVTWHWDAEEPVAPDYSLLKELVS